MSESGGECPRIERERVRVRVQMAARGSDAADPPRALDARITSPRRRFSCSAAKALCGEMDASVRSMSDDGERR